MNPFWENIGPRLFVRCGNGGRRDRTEAGSVRREGRKADSARDGGLSALPHRTLTDPLRRPCANRPRPRRVGSQRIRMGLRCSMAAPRPAAAGGRRVVYHAEWPSGQVRMGEGMCADAGRPAPVGAAALCAFPVPGPCFKHASAVSGERLGVSRVACFRGPSGTSRPIKDLGGPRKHGTLPRLHNRSIDPAQGRRKPESAPAPLTAGGIGSLVATAEAVR